MLCLQLLTAKELVKRMIDYMSTEDDLKCGKIQLRKGREKTVAIRNSYLKLQMNVSYLLFFNKLRKSDVF